MFGIISRVISSVAAFLFPIFASYKALKANDQTQLTPWLMYWVVIACVITVENFLGWFLNLLPLYQEAKAIFLLWLVLPQTQGATYLYLTYVHPYILTHEREIEDLISSGHEQLRRNGMTYLRRLWAYLQQLIGNVDAQARPPSPPQPPPTQSYAQSLLQKFSLPPIGPFDPASNFLSSIFSTFTGPQATAAQPSSSNMASSFVLPNLPREEKLSYIEAQKRKLVEYIKFLDDAAAQHHNEDLTSPSRFPASLSLGIPSQQRGVESVESSPPPQTEFPSPTPAESKRLSGASFLGQSLTPQYTDEGFEAVDPEDLPAAAAVSSGVKTPDEVTRRGWFAGWGGGNTRSVSAPQPVQQPSQTPPE